jgi:hypothetical protein
MPLECNSLLSKVSRLMVGLAICGWLWLLPVRGALPARRRKWRAVSVGVMALVMARF